MTANETIKSKTTSTYRWLSDNRSLMWVLVISLLLKVGLVAIGKVINPDGALYIAAAQQYAVGNFSEALRLYPMPAFPLLIAMVHMVIPDWVAAARVITITAMVLSSVPVYAITARFFSRRAAFWAALFLAITPEANENALRVIRDPLFLLFALTSVYYIVKSIQQRHLGWVFAGFLFGCAALLFRVEGIVIIVMPGVFFLLISSIDKQLAMRRFALKSAALWLGIPMASGLVGALLLGPHLITQNRIDELVKEFVSIIRFSAFEKYHQIYAYFKEIHNSPPFSGFSHSLPATVRHWMPLVYLIGLIESLVKQLFVIFLVPLLLNFKLRSRSDLKLKTEKWFVLLLFTGYMLFLYYFLVTRDRMVGRLLFTPAVLLYPWIGQGFSLMLDSFQKVRFSRIAQVAVLIFFIAVPCIKSTRAVINSDRDAIDVGHYILKDQNLENKNIIFSDAIFCFYSEKVDGFFEIMNTAKIINELLEKERFSEIEALALAHQADVIVLNMNLKNNEKMPVFQKYSEYKRLNGRKYETIIYRVNP